ncbi:MAG: hypothetical protein JXX29_05560 [Deltaproteobacteria bacterium]|nr:hypothetical protein [Deltaproteobacteria bacterium]MBN2671116.1 hypothetical protein [Deltaproteobacteria bacterium]
MKHCMLKTVLFCFFISVFSGGCGGSEDNKSSTKQGDSPSKKAPPKAAPPKIKQPKFEHEYLVRGRKNLLVFEGAVEKISTVPRVEEMNYDDLISTIKVTVNTVIHGRTDAKYLVIQIPVVRGKTALPAASIQTGDHIRFSAVPWDDVIESVKSIEQVDHVMDYQSPVYFALAFATPEKKKEPAPEQIARMRAAAIQKTRTVIEGELARYGQGDWETWRKSMEPLYDEIEDRASALPENKFGSSGLIVEPTLPTEIQGTPSNENPGVTQIIEFERELRSHGIDFIYVSIPRPWLIYPEDITKVTPPHDYVTPNYRQNLLSLLEADVEVVDTLPLLLAHKHNPSTNTKFYTPNSGDLHPPMEAMGIVADAVAERLQRYGYTSMQYEFLTSQPMIRPGAVHQELLQIVTADGMLYQDNADSPVLFIGDSTIRVNHPAPAVGFTAQLAQRMGFRPSLRQRNSFKLADFAKEPSSILQGKRVVVWVAWSLCLGKINARICWKPKVDWNQSRVFAAPK